MICCRCSNKPSRIWRCFKNAKLRPILAIIVLITYLIFFYTQRKIPSTIDVHLKVQCHQCWTPHDKDGMLNVDIWRDICTLNFNSLRQHPFFPSYPRTRSYLNIKNTTWILPDVQSSYGLRVMGYLHCPLSGYYLFYLPSSFMTQFWLSTSGPENATKVAYTTKNKRANFVYFAGTPKPISEKIFLEQGKKYYFEILKVLNDGIPGIHLLATLQWMVPGTSSFTNISGRYFSHYSNASVNVADNSSPSLLFSDEEDEAIKQYFPLKEGVQTAEFQRFNRQNVESLPYLKRNYSLMAFPKCKYQPYYKRGDGVWSVPYPKIYPNDGSGNVKFSFNNKDDDRIQGAIFMTEKEADSVVTTFMNGIEKTFPRTFELVDIIHMEQVNREGKKDRFLLELVLKQHHDNTFYRVSEFMSRNRTGNQLCILEELAWNPTVWIHVILNVKNQADWVLYFIKDISRVIRKTGERFVNIIIVDFGNNGLEIDKEMDRHGIKSYNIIKKNGEFHKTASINLAASQVKDPNHIVLLMDLHLRLPLDFFDVIRKHTFKGLAFAPIVFRLDLCGRPRTKRISPSGHWESLGYGIFSIYKSDWDNFGGMDEIKFKNKWGGEDWNMVERVLSKGIEIGKKRVLGFYHFYHDKKGMWDNH